MNTEIGQDANEIIIEILESYMEFVDIFEKTIKNKYFGTQQMLTAKPFMELLIQQKRANWKPILEQAKNKRNIHFEQTENNGGKK